MVEIGFLGACVLLWLVAAVVIGRRNRRKGVAVVVFQKVGLLLLRNCDGRGIHPIPVVWSCCRYHQYRACLHN